jgi:hypothetical protein
MDEIELNIDSESHAHERIQAAGATAVSLLLAAGLGAWLFLNPGSSRSTTSMAPEAANDPPPSARSFDQGDRESDAAENSRPRNAPAVYLVATQEHADAVLVAIYDAAAIRTSFDEPIPDEWVVVLDSAEAEERFMRAMHEQDAVRGGMGLPAFRVADLRARRRRRPWSSSARGRSSAMSPARGSFRYRITERYVDSRS